MTRTLFVALTIISGCKKTEKQAEPALPATPPPSTLDAAAPHKLPSGKLDGLVGGLDGGDFAVTSWDCKCVYRGKPGGEWTPIVKDFETPADLGYDTKRKRLVIPSFTTNKIALHQL